jgi:hypothetical protein
MGHNMSTRKEVLEHMRLAGYNDDYHAFTRLYAENRIGYDAAHERWYKGQEQRRQQQEQADEAHSNPNWR